MSTPIAIRQTRQAATKADPLGLTPRERQVATMMYAGKTAPAIARELGVKHETVRRFLKDTYRKLRVHSSLELVAYLRRHEQTQELSEPFEAELDRAAHESDPRTLEYGGYET